MQIYPLVPAKAGTQGSKECVSLNSRTRGNERWKDCAASLQPHVWRMTKPYLTSVTLSRTIFLLFPAHCLAAPAGRRNCHDAWSIPP